MSFVVANDGASNWLTIAAMAVSRGEVARTCGGKRAPDSELRDYRRYIGLRSGHPVDVQLSWLAAEGLCAPLPDGWTEHLEPDFGLVFFREAATGQCTWRHPVDHHLFEALPRIQELGTKLLRLNEHHPASSFSSIGDRPSGLALLPTLADRERVQPEVVGQVVQGNQTLLFARTVQDEREQLW